MAPRRVGLLTVVFLVGTSAAAATARADDDGHHDERREDREHTIVVGVGGAAEVELSGGEVHPGGSVMIEWEGIDDWLELELGASVLSAEGGLVVPVDLLFKKPFRLAPWSEVMVGLGPEIVATSLPRATYFGAEAAVDLMFWPCGPRTGLWVEPELDVVGLGAAGGVSTGVGSTGGLLIGW
jgi:hypothetical protein